MTRVTKGNNGITQKYNAVTHRGVDIGWHNFEDDNIIIAHSDGVVENLVKNYNKTDKSGSSYGNFILIKHDNGYKTRYSHLKYGSISVKVGDRVKKGREIAVMGNTGRSSGRHLHFEVINPKGVRIDPTGYIKADLPNSNTLKIGKYKILYEKYVRTTPEVRSDNKVLYNRISTDLLAKFTKDKKGYAKYRVGATADVTGFKIDSKGNTWAKTRNTYFCIKDSTGLQAKEV